MTLFSWFVIVAAATCLSFFVLVMIIHSLSFVLCTLCAIFSSSLFALLYCAFVFASTFFFIIIVIGIIIVIIIMVGAPALLVDCILKCIYVHIHK